MKILATAFLTIIAAALSAQQADFVACSGRIVPKERVQKLAATAPSGAQAVVRELKISAGDILKAGDTVAIISGEDTAAAALARAEAALETAKSARDIKVLQQKNFIADLQGEAQQISNVLTEKDPPRREREELEYQHTGLLRRIAQARAMLPLVEKNQNDIVAEAQAAVDEARKMHQAYFVKTPIGGRVLETHVRNGEIVPMEGICEIADSSEIFAEAEVYVSDISKVKVGQSAQISSEALGGKTFIGKVVELSRMVKTNKVFSSDPSDFSNLRVVRAKIKLDTPEPFAKLIGSRVDVRISAR